MITIQKSAGVFCDSYEFPHPPHVHRGTLRRFRPTSTIPYTISYSYNILLLQYINNRNTCDTSLHVYNIGRIPKLKKTSNPIFVLCGSWRIGFPTRNCYARVEDSEATAEEEEHSDYTLHATQDDKHHDNARTN